MSLCESKVIQWRADVVVVCCNVCSTDVLSTFGTRQGRQPFLVKWQSAALLWSSIL